MASRMPCSKIMLTLDDVKMLAAVGGPCLSILQPVNDSGAPGTHAESRLATAAQQADALLAARGFDEDARAKFLRPVHKIARNTNWLGRTGSVILFRAPGFAKASFWPDALEPRVELGDEFLTLPLLPGLSTRSFWVLALSINGIHLYRGSGRGLSEVELPANLPRSLADADGFDQPDHDLEARSAPGAATGQTAAIRFGTSSLSETKTARLRDFFKCIDRGIHPILLGGRDPLILAAVVQEIALYRQVNSYSPLLPEAIHGSPQALGEDRLHRQALELMASNAARTLAEQSKTEIDSAAGRGLLLTDISEIRQASSVGQVERLFLRAIPHALPQSNEAAINRAALAVIRNSGTVVCSDSAATPTEGVAAILRYPIVRPPVQAPL